MGIRLRPPIAVSRRAVGLLMALIAALAVWLAFPRALAAQTVIELPSAPVNPGWLYLDRFMPDKQAESKGLVRPSLWVNRVDDAQKTAGRVASGGFEPGVMIPLAEGWYDIAIAQFPDEDPSNRHRYYVKQGQVTVVRSGLLGIQTLPESDQPSDVCRPWSAAMTVMALTADSKGAHSVIMSGSAAHVKDRGLLQLHPGRYLVEWNGLRTEVEVTANQITPVATGFVGPFHGKQKPRIHMQKEEAADNAVISACEKQPTQVLVGSFWLSFIAPEPVSDDEEGDSGIVSMAKSARAWEPLVVDPHAPTKIAPISGDRIKGTPVYKGKGSNPDEHLM